MNATPTPPGPRTPTPPAAPEGLRCPNCRAELKPGQDWCLECGNAVTTSVLPPPGWQLPVAIVLGIVLLTVVIVAVAVSALSGDADEDAASAIRGTTTTKTTPRSTPSRTRTTATTTTTASSSGLATTAGGLAQWPSGKAGFTVVLLTTPFESGAVTRAKSLQQRGVEDVGVLDGKAYSSLTDGQFFVFSGRYDTSEAATSAADALSGKGDKGYVQEVKP